MKTFFYHFRIALLFLSAAFLSAHAQQFNPNLAAKLQETLDTQVATFTDTKGVSASVYYPGQGIWKGTSGMSYAGHPITSDMEFGLASNTKLFTAAAILKLVEGNVLNLNDQLHKWLPKYANVDTTITIRQLLNHTSGVADVFTTESLAYIDANPTHVFTTAEVMALIGPKLFNPGASFSYSNTNYILAGMVAESATGQHISKIIRDSILTPLQLDSTFFDGKETVLGTIAHPWNNGVDGINISRAALNSAGNGTGAMYSTAGEMAQWYQALLSGQVLNPNSLAQMLTFLPPGNYGFGISSMQIFGRTVWGHGGSNSGYKSRMFYDPDMKAVVCGLSNSNPSAIDGAITGVLLKVLVDYLPASAGTISGTTSVCQGQTSIKYTVPAITNAVSYIWTLPDGATGTSATNSITVNYSASAVSGIITVKGSNTYGDGAISKLPVTVHPLPVVTYRPSSQITLCQYSAPIILAGGSPAGGAYAGTGVVNGVFDPSVSGVGEFMITYFFTNTNGCSNADSSVITVVPRPTVTFAMTPQNKICQNSVPIILSGGMPSGGVFSGIGVKNGVFDPSVSGAGSFMITYSFTDSNGCSNADSALLTVVPKPTVSLTLASQNKLCLNTPPVILAGGTPAGGIYSGKGVTNGIFNPSVSGEGIFSIIYSYTNANGCTNSDSGRIKVAVPTSSTLTETVAGSLTLNGKTYTQSGTYIQVLENMEGCDSTITIQLTITASGIHELPNKENCTIYPNPSNGKFTIATKSVGSIDTEIEIYSVTGMKMFSGALPNSKTELSLQLIPGIYLYHIKERNQIISIGRLIIY